jgi:hypothetical protein
MPLLAGTQDYDLAETLGELGEEGRAHLYRHLLDEALAVERAE